MIDSTDILFATTRPLPAHECRVIELRRYTLHAGRRETLIELFDREFVEAQEVVGISVIGQFRDLDDAGAFVWLRGFADMAARREGLAAFCGGPVWKAHREQATRRWSPATTCGCCGRPGLARASRRRVRCAVGARQRSCGLLEASVFALREPASTELLALAREQMSPCLMQGGAQALGWYVSEPARNDFPRLPVREGEPVLVLLGMFGDAALHQAWMAQAPRWWERAPGLAAPPQVLRLAPTARSALQAS